MLKTDQKRTNMLVRVSALWTGGIWVPRAAAGWAVLSALQRQNAAFNKALNSPGFLMYSDKLQIVPKVPSIF